MGLVDQVELVVAKDVEAEEVAGDVVAQLRS